MGAVPKPYPLLLGERNMASSVIFNSPILLVLYGLALAIALFELVNRSTGFVLPIVSLAIVIGTSIYAILLGATLFEIAIIVLVFLLLSLIGIRRKRG